MNELTQSNIQLPNTVEELAKFALVGREKLNVVRAAIRAIDKVGLANEVREQKLKEGQDIAEAVLDAEVRIGQLLKEVPKATSGSGSNQFEQKVSAVEHSATPKEEARKEAGISKAQAFRFQVMAEHPDVVEKAKAEARDKDEIISRNKVLEDISKKVAKPDARREYYKKIEQEHEAFKEAKAVSIEDIKNDKSNRKQLAFKKIYSVIHRVAGDLFAISLEYHGKELKDICREMEMQQRMDSISNLRNIIKESNNLIAILEETK